VSKKSFSIVLSVILVTSFLSYPNLIQPAYSQTTTQDLKVAFIGDQGTNPFTTIRVLQMIKNEGADMVIHQGDFDYVDNPTVWDNNINTYLGPSFPYFASVGNHDVAAWSGYQQKLQDRLNLIPGAVCTGNLGVNSSCHYQGLFFILSGVGTLGSGHVTYIKNQLAQDDSVWSICSWHKNRDAMQVGLKSDVVRWGAYEECRKGGAIIATGHAHSYERTRTLISTEFQAVDPDWPDTNEVRVAPDSTFVFVSGLGGQSITNQDRCLPDTFPYGCNGEWASIYTSNQVATFGALFCTFNVAGQADKASCYFKDILGNVPDSFNVTSFMGSTTSSPQISHAGKELDSKRTFNVMDFGAIPNDGQDDSFAFQRIINMSPRNQTLVIKVPEGTFDFFSQVRLESNLVIEGDNQKNTIILWHTGAKHKNIFYALGQADNPLRNIAIKNIALIGTGVETMGDCIHLKNVSNYTIQNTTLSDCGSGSNGAAIYARNTADGIIVYNKIYNTRNGYLNPRNFDTETQTIGGSTNILIGYNLIINSTDDGIHPVHGTGNIVIGNVVIDSGDDNIDTFGEKNTKIINNTIIMTTNSSHVTGIEIGDGSENIEVSGNQVIGGSLYGINISSGGSGPGVRINKNITIFDNEVSETTAGCVRIRFAEDIKVFDNHFEGCTQANNKDEVSAIRIKEEVKNVIIKNNTIQFDSGKGRSGILISEARNIEIISNNFVASERNLENCVPISIRKDADDLKILDNYFQPCECLVKNKSEGKNILTSNKFSISSEFEENIYHISGKTGNNHVSSFKIIPGSSVMIDLECPSPEMIEITFPRNLIDGIHTITAESEDSSKKISFEHISNSSDSTTIKFNVPSKTKSLEFKGSTVIPEFSTFTSLILILSFSMILLFRKSLENLRGFRTM